MMRINSGIFCALAMTLAFACADSSSGDDDGSGSGSGSNVMSGCGDGVCSPSEVGFCMSDCGNGSNGNSGASCGNGQCETTKGENGSSCPQDCGGGSGSGSGSGSGTSTLNCSDPNTTLGCLLCTGLMQCTPPYDASSCAACGGGMGSGSGFGDILCTGGAPDGTCDSMESNQTCPSDCP